MLEFNEFAAERETFFVEVILPLSISRSYTYRVPAALNSQIGIGKRVIVQFGKSRIYTAIVERITTQAPVLYEAKYILDILDEDPIVNPIQLQLWNWMAEYYMCNVGEVMQAALPAALKLASETRILLVPNPDFDKSTLSDKEYLIVDALEIQPELRVADIAKLLGQKTVFPLLKSLFNKGVIDISEEVIERYKPRRKAFIILNPMYEDAGNRRVLFEILEKAPKQLDALLAYMKLSRQHKDISREMLQEESGCSAAIIKGLVDKDVFILDKRVISRFSDYELELLKNFELSEAQHTALAEIKKGFEKKEVVLLHGITSSGKTQLYIRLIEEVLKKNRQVLYLLPEIGLTTQLIERLRQYFGNKIGIYHSKFSDNERAEVWNKVLKQEYQIVLGARSAVFLPFKDLGLIVVDEEHENSFKQYDPAPRYHARDTSIFIAHLHKAKVLLGSATPSLESFFNAHNGKYGFVELKERFGTSQLPSIRIVSIGEETSKKTMQGHLSSVLVEEMQNALANKDQVILFQNRRGYTPILICRTCGFLPKCINCDVSLTYHKSSGKLHCHYCGYKQETISICPACGSVHIEQKGFGTEKIEDDLQYVFPDARVARLDLDSTRSKNGYQQILGDFEEKKIDILVGTQMVAKGLDFASVTVIGIINADGLLNFPDFRAYERSYQLLAQVAGRAGRREKEGKVIIQTNNQNHRILDLVIQNNYDDLYKGEIIERNSFQYPPVYRLIKLDVKHKDAMSLSEIALRLANQLKASFGSRVLGPEEPLISRIRNLYIKAIYLKVERNGISISKVKEHLKDILLKFEADKSNKGAFVQIDVDPY